MPEELSRIVNTPISRRRFLRYGIASGAAAFALQGFPTHAQRSGGRMVWLGHQEVAGLSPNDIGPTVQAVIILNILNPLFQLNHLTELEPILAESYEVAEDGLTYTFRLHESVLFHNGKELTGEDVKYTFEFYSQEGNTIASEFLGMGSVEAVDRYTVQVKMNEVNAAFLSNAGTVPIVPAAYHAEVGEDVFRAQPIGTGAFSLREWRAAELTELEAFENHFRGRPEVDVIRLEVVPEPSVRNIALMSGNAHSSVWPLLVEDSLAFEDHPDFRLVRTLANSVKLFALNNELPQFSDRRVRRAMLMALDRQRIIDDLWQGAAVIAHSSLSPNNVFYHNPNVRQYEYDPDAAMALLEEAGWTVGEGSIREKDGLRLSFTCTTITGDQARRPIAELSQVMLRQVGVDMRLAEAPVAAIIEGLRAGTLESSIFNLSFGTTPEPDPSGTLRSDGGNNLNRYSNPEMDRLIDEGLRTVDPNRRWEIYYRIQEIVAEDVPFLYLHFDEWMNVFSKQIQGLPGEILASAPVYYNAHRLWLE
jgi:peptide/nickel transport system substrate-binding protein